MSEEDLMFIIANWSAITIDAYNNNWNYGFEQYYIITSDNNNNSDLVNAYFLASLEYVNDEIGK